MVARLLKSQLQYTTAAHSSYIIRIPNANVYRFGDSDVARPVLRAVDWTVREGESWAVVGSGAGEKTALLEVSERLLTRYILFPASLDLFHVPLSMPATYMRHADPSREHADIPPSTWRTFAIAITQSSPY